LFFIPKFSLFLEKIVDMNKISFTLLLMAFLASSVIAQNADHVNRGGLGFVKLGLGFGTPGDLNDDLATTFGQNADIKGNAIDIGAGGFLLFSKRILVGVEGFGYFHPKKDIGESSAKLTGGGGELKLGFALLNNNKFLGFPYLGLGFGGNRVEITNRDGDKRTFGTETNIPVNFEERLRAKYAILDLGISLFKIPAPDTDGISIGGHIGYRTSLGKDTWQMDNDDDVIGANDMGISTFYIKLSIGGGGFFYKKKKEKETP